MTRSEFSIAVKREAWQRCKGFCEWCSAPLFTGNVEYHHDKERTLGGKGKISNCVVLCRSCHKSVTARRAKVIAKSNRARDRHVGIKPRGKSFATNKDGTHKKRIDGTVERRS